MADKFKMDDYIDVAERIAEFRSKHPDGSLQQVAVEFREVAGEWGVLFTAAAYRTPDDIRPGHGTAWEPFPGRTPYTKGSEIQNAETSAWGRAIVAALAADTKKGVASADEVRNRSAERQHTGPVVDLKTQVWAASKVKDPVLTDEERRAWIRGELAANGNDMEALLREWAA